MFYYKKEISAVVLISIFIFLAISFLSFNPHDPSWFYFSSNGIAVTNWAGKIGANIAAFFFYYLGSASYILLFTLLFIAYLLFFKKKLADQWDRFLALILLLFTSTILLKAFSIDVSMTYPGGWFGNTIYNMLQPSLGFVGILVFLFMFLWISFTILFRISFLKSMLFVLNILKTASFYAAKYLFKIFKFIIWYLFELLKAIWNKIKSKVFKKGGGQEGQEEWGEYKNYLSGKRKDIKIEDRSEEKSEDDDILKSLGNMAEKVQNGHFLASEVEDSQSVATQKTSEPIDLLDDLILGDDRVSKIVRRFENKEIFRVSHPSTGSGRAGCSKFLILANTVLYKNIFSSGSGLAYKNILHEVRKMKELISRLAEEKKDVIKFDLPDLSIFKDEDGNSFDNKNLQKECELRGQKLEEKLHRFGIKGTVTAIKPGPVVTMFEFQPEIDSKISKIIALEDDLAMALTAMSIRIIAPIPGKSVVGFEISNYTRNSVFLSDLMLTDQFENFKGKIPLALGVDITGKPIIEDLVYMPHLLVAGSTGSGKSVGLNSMLLGILCKFRPDQLKLILIDPKRLEFAPYADIPHLLFPIVTNPRQAAPVLKWVVQEMENRYETMANVGVRNVLEYQKFYESASKSKMEQLGLMQMPFIVIMIDELADLMMVAGKDVEAQIARIAQMARAAGIHMILATQRPSVDVVTGLIKVNFPSRIAFRVSSKIDSRTIIDSPGAEKLLGRGDMLYLNSTSSDLQRLHGAYVSDYQVEKLTSHLRAQQKPQYLDLNEELKRVEFQDSTEFSDDLYDEILEFIKKRDEVSISMIQRHYRIGFNRSARIIERLEMDGLIAPAQGSKPRKVLG